MFGTRKQSCADKLPADDGSQAIVRATRAYSAQHESELSLAVGDIVVQLDESSGWLEGELNGHRGWFPEDHVAAISPAPGAVQARRKTMLHSSEEVEGIQQGSIIQKRKLTSERLESFLTIRRPQKADLENRNILPAGTAVSASCSPQVVEAQKKLEKTKKAQVLSNFLKGTNIFRKREDKVKGSVFGTNIFDTAEGQWQLPAVVTSCVQHLESALDTQGLFRLSGNQLDINKWKEELNTRGGQINFSNEDADVHVVACLLKEYIRSLPEPPIPFNLYDVLMDIMDLPDGSRRTEEVVSLLRKNLPNPNRVFLNFMLEFLHKVSLHSDVNMMTSANLGIIFGQSFVRPKIDTMEKMMSPKPVELVAALIDLGSIDANSA